MHGRKYPSAGVLPDCYRMLKNLVNVNFCKLDLKLPIMNKKKNTNIACGYSSAEGLISKATEENRYKFSGGYSRRVIILFQFQLKGCGHHS